MVIMMEHVEVKVSDSFATDRLPELMALFAGQWWTKGRTVDDVAAMLDHSDLIATVTDTHTGDLLGFARVLTDFTYVACLMDVIGGGGGLGWRLSCQQDLEAFYARWGFTSRVGGSRLMRRTTRFKPSMRDGLHLTSGGSRVLLSD